MNIRNRTLLSAIIMTFLIIVMVPATISFAASKKEATLSNKAKDAYVKEVKKLKTSIKNSLSRIGFSGVGESFYKVTYRFMDVDGDKKQEMLVSGGIGRGDAESLVQSSVYKYRKGKVVCVLKCPYLKGRNWQPSFYRYYAKTHTLVFESFSNLGIPRYELYYKWNGSKFVLKVKKSAYYTPYTGWYTDDISYDKGSESLQKELMKGEAENLQNAGKGKVYHY